MTHNTSLNNCHCYCYNRRHQFAPPLLQQLPLPVCAIVGVSPPTSSKREKGGLSPASQCCIVSRMLSAAKKRRVTSSNSSFNSDDDDDPPAIRDITTNVSVSKNNKSDFRVIYIVSFTKPCCDNHIKGKRVRNQICLETAFFQDGADTCSLMKEKTIKAIRSYKNSKKFDGIHLCNLDYGIGIGSVYMASNHSSESLWKLVYSSAENNMNKLLLKRYASGMTQTNQHEAKADALMHAK
jgi:hypothetical protein